MARDTRSPSIWRKARGSIRSDEVGLHCQFQRNEPMCGEALELPHHRCRLRTDIQHIGSERYLAEFDRFGNNRRALPSLQFRPSSPACRHDHRGDARRKQCRRQREGRCAIQKCCEQLRQHGLSLLFMVVNPTNIFAKLGDSLSAPPAGLLHTRMSARVDHAGKPVPCEANRYMW